MHFLQTTPWQSFQEKLGRQTFRQSGDGWEYLATLEHGKGNTRLYCPYGPWASNESAFREAITSLASLGKELGVTFLRIEPTEAAWANLLKVEGWRKVTYQSLNPEHTIVIDLNRPEDLIISEMSQPARNIYRNYHKKDLEIKTSSDPADIGIFLDLIHQVSQKTGMRPHSDSYFQTQAESLFPAGAAKLWYVNHQNKPIAAALLYDGPDARYYAHAAADSSPELRKLNAGTALVAEAIIDAKRAGLKSFDLYGIAPEGSSKDHPWHGFTRFKRSFGGEEITFAGSWDLPLKPLGYWIYRTYQTIRK